MKWRISGRCRWDTAYVHMYPSQCWSNRQAHWPIDRVIHEFDGQSRLWVGEISTNWPATPYCSYATNYQRIISLIITTNRFHYYPFLIIWFSPEFQVMFYTILSWKAPLFQSRTCLGRLLRLAQSQTGMKLEYTQVGKPPWMVEKWAEKNIDYMCGLIWWLSIWEKNIYIYMYVYVYIYIYVDGNINISLLWLEYDGNQYGLISFNRVW